MRDKINRGANKAMPSLNDTISDIHFPSICRHALYAAIIFLSLSLSLNFMSPQRNRKPGPVLEAMAGYSGLK